MINGAHPYFFIERLVSTHSEATFHLSKYRYVPDSLLDEREETHVAAIEFTPQWLDYQLATLRSDQELALHSNMTIKGRTFHVPMIDLSLPTIPTARVLNRMQLLLFKQVFLNLGFFETGRSFHAYSTALMAPNEWLQFMGRLLLINPRGEREIIDTRWVGHRLISGYCSLRWSNNSGQYLGMPRFVGNPVTLGNSSNLQFGRVG
jgi:hypothetical protein